MGALAKILPLISKLLSADPKSIVGTINPAELLKVIATSALSGGGLMALLAAVAAASGTIFVDPSTASGVAALITLAIDLYRRFGHGAALGYTKVPTVTIGGGSIVTTAPPSVGFTAGDVPGLKIVH